ncbi:MAG: hemolysin family protein [Bacilli bacterium]
MDTNGMSIILVILVICSGFFSGAETAYTSLNRVRVKILADENDKRAQKTLLIFDNFDITITTILFCNNVVNIGTASLGTVLMFQLFPRLSTNYVALFSTFFVTLIVLIFGEVLPKNYSKSHPEKFALAASGLLLILIRILKPFSYPILKINKQVKKIYGNAENEASTTEIELKAYIDSIEEEGIIEEEEGELVRSVLDFDETSIGDILTPRTDIVGIDISMDKEELLKIIFSEKYSRLPLYDDNLDNVLGLIYERDILVYLAKEKEINLEQMKRPAFLVPKSMKAANLLKYLQERNAHMAIVIDEHGGTCGLITMEDLLEEIVGEIWDEHDEVIEKVIEKDGYYLVQYDEPIDDLFEKYLNSDELPETEYPTVGGWVYDLLEVIPSEGDEVTYETNNLILKIKVVDVDNNRIEKLTIKAIHKLTNDKEFKL